MNDTAAQFDIEDCTGRLLAGMEKVEYLADTISEKIRKQDSQKPECAILRREMITNLDIIDNVYTFWYDGGVKGDDKYVNGTGYNCKKRVERCL